MPPIHKKDLKAIKESQSMESIPVGVFPTQFRSFGKQVACRRGRPESELSETQHRSKQTEILDEIPSPPQTFRSRENDLVSSGCNARRKA